jgi:hypothetical protein
MEVRLVESHADIATSWLARAPSIAATSMRGGMLALLVKLRERPRTASERESVHRIVASLGKLKGKHRLETSGGIVEIRAS